jgi:hypothetical protein
MWKPRGPEGARAHLKNKDRHFEGSGPAPVCQLVVPKQLPYKEVLQVGCQALCDPLVLGPPWHLGQ